MACIIEKECPECKKNKPINIHDNFDMICHDCKVARLNADRNDQLKYLESLSVEERLRTIEEWIHKYKQTHTLSEKCKIIKDDEK